MIRSISKGAVAATLLGMGLTTSGLAQSPVGAIRPIEDTAKKPTGATPESAPSISETEMLPFPKVDETASYTGPAIIPPGDFFKVPMATIRVKTEQEPDSSSESAAPKAQVVIEPVQTKLVTPVVTGKTERPSLWKRLFGKREAASSCQTNCVPCDPKAIDRVAPAVQSGAATPKSGTIEFPNDSTPGRADLDSIPGRATVNASAGRATVDGVRGRATVYLSVPPDRIQLANLPRNQDPV